MFFSFFILQHIAYVSNLSTIFLIIVVENLFVLHKHELMSVKNPKNIQGISFGQDVDLLKKGKKRCEELGITSFSEYVKQLIRYDLGLPNIISAYIGKTIEDKKAEDALIAAFLAEDNRKSKKNNVA